MQTLRQSDKCFCQYQFWCKNVNILQKMWNFGRNVDFFIKCALLLKVIMLLQNMPIFWKIVILYSKCHFVQWYFGQECHFNNIFYNTLGINSLKQFFEKGVNLVVNFGKNDTVLEVF